MVSYPNDCKQNIVVLFQSESCMPVEACVNIGSGTEAFPLIAERIGFAEIRHVVEDHIVSSPRMYSETPRCDVSTGKTGSYNFRILFLMDVTKCFVTSAEGSGAKISVFSSLLRIRK